MSLKANALKNNEAQKKAVSKELNSILPRIDDEIKLAHEQGKDRAIISLPITFAIPYMKNKDAQRIIYYKILTSLLERDFKNIEIDLKKNATLFYVSWLTEEEQNELVLQHTLLAKHTKKDNSQELSKDLDE